MEKKSFTFDEIKLKMLNYCVYQDRCHYEVEQKMREFLLIPEAKEEILLYLIQEKYLDEERFVRSYIRGKFYIKHWGRNKIKLNLKQKQISDKLMGRCWDEIDDSDYQKQIILFIEKQSGSINEPNAFKKKNKIIKFLLSKGYEYDCILDAFGLMEY
ncbi:regulatory protein [Soonwooa buanensis]|uniref:Regulatory protein RecX n=1 Tax=Soonwooa buanensis TaxID=619805 RepID=A0A1T5GRL6_9FLAO|nr:RecX family transcriptional regulator [Soonwooa buanensis]SKC11053.1 regulatory protein [Soonwooa buanensis]